MEDNSVRITKYRRKGGVPFVAVLCVLLLVYLLLRSRALFLGDTFSAYNVGAPSYDRSDTAFTGMILRDEKMVFAESAGTVLCCRSSGERLAKDSLVLVIDRSGGLSDRLSEYLRTESISGDGLEQIRELLKQIQNSYDPADFSTALKAGDLLKSGLYTAILTECGSDLITFLSDDTPVHVFAPESGFLIYRQDGYESASPSSLTLSDFSSEPESLETRSGGSVSSGDFLYKLVPDNKFTLVFPLSDEQAAALSGRKTLKVTMPDSLEISGSFTETMLGDGTRAGVLSFQKYGLNYLDERIIGFSLSDEGTLCFRIPESALVNRSYFVVPSEFVSESGEKREKSVLRKTADGAEAVTVSACTKGSDDSAKLIIGDGVTYIFSEELSAGDVILYEEEDPETGALRSCEMTLAVTASLSGVYQINRGYCIFRPVLILGDSVNSSYVCVSSDISYSISAYDRILLNAAGVSENEIIYE